MKILVASFTYAPNVDGVAEAAKTMVANFRKAGNEVFIATFSSNETLGEPKQEDDTFIHRFYITGAPAMMVGFRGEIKAYQNFIISLNPDVIIFHGWDTWPLEVALPLLPRLSAKSVLLSHGQSSHLLNLSTLPRGLGKWLRWLPHVLSLPCKLRQFDRVVFLSNKSDWGRFFDVWVAKLTGARNVVIIPNGVSELPVFDSGVFRLQHNLGQRLFFLCIANFSTRKNQERALRAFAEASLPDATLVFIGSELGEYGKKMRNLWHEFQSIGAEGRVVFLEKIERNETLAALLDCDVKILAADAETQPIVLLEAMAAAKPFISTDTGCVAEFKGGIIVRSTSEMAQAMRRLAASPDDRKKLGAEGRRDYETHYSVQLTSKAWLEMLESMTKE